jgi:hypothetical protein
MSNARNLSDLLDSSGDVKSDALDNAQAPLTAGTDYQTPLTAGTDYLTPTGDGSQLSGLSSSTSKSEFPLASGESVTAGDVVSISSAGEVGALPTVNDINDPVDTSSAFPNVAADRIYSIGNKLVGVNWTQVNNSGTSAGRVDVYGAEVDPVNGAITYGSNGSFNTGFYSNDGSPPYQKRFYGWKLEEDVMGLGLSLSGANAGSTHTIVAAVSVGSGGNINIPSKSNANYLTNYQNWTTSTGFYLLDRTKVAMDMNMGGNSPTTKKQFCEWNGNTWSCTVNSSNNGYYHGGMDPDNDQDQTVQAETVTSGGVLLQPYPNTNTYTAKADWGVGNEGTSATTVTLADDYSSRSYMHFLSASKLVQFYYSTNSEYKIATYTISSDGLTPTLVDSLVLDTDYFPNGLGGNRASYHHKSETEMVVAFAHSSDGNNGYITSIKFDANMNIVGVNYPTNIYSTTYCRVGYDTTDDIYTVTTYNSASTGPFVQVYEVNDYSTEFLQPIGIAESDASSGNVTVITSGVVDGFTSLTPRSVYYASPDGTLTTTGGTNPKIGRAVSSTELLLGEF